ncbi:hypothetical protein EMPS_01307 [Entomortierella parvispora]|uniref:Uncharacterized protein n=1 Tax=Entomortierella parvispora TaxID=205924 RepID=A0A9P3H2L4_9FUNG|nr:hypothetical protein EMPS_01307 [Entomortierella parvispora]
MMSMIRNTFAKVAPAATRSISNSSKTNNASVTLGHVANMASESASPASSSSAKTFKAVAYTVLGSTALVAGVSHLLKDEVVYWTPNVRK